jgi:hypothetical protein
VGFIARTKPAKLMAKRLFTKADSSSLGIQAKKIMEKAIQG